MLSLTVPSLSDAITACCKAVLETGERVAPRGMATRELRPAVIRITEPGRRVVCLQGRAVNPAFAAAETLWILSGSDAPWIFDFNGALRRYANDGVLMGAYGPRLRSWEGGKDQLLWVLEVLRQDPDSRRAVVQIFDPGRVDLSHGDIPCTIGFRFYVRSGRLCMHTLMRANDVWLGMPYDVFCFTTIQELMANSLGLEMGDYVHMVDSLHIYDQDLEAAVAVAAGCDRTSPASTTPYRLEIGITDLEVAAAAALNGKAVAGGFMEHGILMAAYRAVKAGEEPDAEDLARLSPAFSQCFQIWRAARSRLAAPQHQAKP